MVLKNQSIIHYLHTVESNPRLLAEGEHLPESHPEHPGVGGVRELARLEALRCAPGERNLLPLGHHVAVVLLGQGAHEAKVANLDPVHGDHHDVAAGQVTVDEALQLQICHTSGYTTQILLKHFTIHVDSVAEPVSFLTGSDFFAGSGSCLIKVLAFSFN